MAAMVALYTHSDMFDHRPGEGHPERPERLRAVADALNDATDLDLEPREAPQAEIADLERVHPAAYVEAIDRGEWFDPLRTGLDAYVNATSEQMTGTIRVRLLKGGAQVVGRKTQHV